MNYELRVIDAKKYQKFLEDSDLNQTFLQSKAYGRLRTTAGETIYYFGLFENQKLFGVTLIQKIKTRLKTFLHIPHGPLFQEKGENDKAEIWAFFLKDYVKFGKKEKCDFVRISPLCTQEEKRFFTVNGFRDAAIHLVNPEKTWVLDITKNEETLLNEMKKSTRYEVRKGLKEQTNFEIKKGNSIEDLNIFWELHMETVKRQGFVPFNRKSTEKELELFGKNCQVISISHEQNPLASGIFLFDKNQGYYHQGASVFSKLPAAHAYIWQAILEAKKRGCHTFNFWGVCGEEDKKHPWYGLSKFKRGFSGEEKNILHVQDYPLTSRYWLTVGIEKYRKWKRGY